MDGQRQTGFDGARPTHDPIPAPHAHGQQYDPRDHEPLSDTFLNLLDEGKSAVAAQLHLVSTGAQMTAQGASKVGMWSGIAAAALFGAATALAVGLVIILASYVGPAIATLIVVLVFALIAAIAGMQARSVARRIANSLKEMRS